MTKMQIVNRYYEILKQARQELDPRLDKLLKEEKITSGARYYVYDKYHWFGTQKISITLEKAAKSKNFKAYINRTNSFNWHYLIADMEKEYKEALEFIEQQEALPFEESQKQQLLKTL